MRVALGVLALVLGGASCGDSGPASPTAIPLGRPFDLRVGGFASTADGTLRMTFERVVGVYAHPDRDPRFHAVTIVVRARVAPPTRPPSNPLEILEARLFGDDELPAELSHGTTEMLARARAEAPTHFE